MILTQNNDLAQPLMKKLNDRHGSFLAGRLLIPEFQTFCKIVSLKETLTQCCKNKQGITVFNIFCTLFSLINQW